jgi:hypothetical protein
MMLKSQFLFNERRENLRDKIFLSERFTGRQAIQNQQTHACEEENDHCLFDSKTQSLKQNNHVSGWCKHRITIIMVLKSGLIIGCDS